MANQVTKFNLRANPSFFLKASRKKSQYGQLFWLSSSSCELAIITGKQLSASAVVRNRLKRQWTATSSQALSSSGLTYQFVFQPFKSAIDLSPEERLKVIRSLIETLKPAEKSL